MITIELSTAREAILEREAKEKGLSPEEYAKFIFESILKPKTDAEIEACFREDDPTGYIDKIRSENDAEIKIEAERRGITLEDYLIELEEEEYACK